MVFRIPVCEVLSKSLRASISFEDISQPVETLQVVEEQLLIFP